MESTINLFTDGLTTDLHPLTVQKNQMTDTLNATFRTFNGNEMILQNDMGNTMIQDSTTGNIMGLRDGFIPVGMKEHGGILYIASFNPKTKDGELGTVPSPVLNYNYVKPYTQSLGTQITNLDGLSNMYVTGGKFVSTPIQISTNRFQVGDQFIVALNFGETLSTVSRTVNSNFIIPKVNSNPVNISFKLITGFLTNNNEITELPDYGMFQLELEAKVERSNQTLPLYAVQSKRQQYFLESQTLPELKNSDYWFVELPETAQLDNELCQANGCYNTYPNILPGYLYIKLKPELPYGFNHFKNKSTGVFSPNVFIITTTE